MGTANFQRLYPAGESSLGGSIRYAAKPEEALAEANDCFIFTEWPEIRAVAPWFTSS